MQEPACYTRRVVRIRRVRMLDRLVLRQIKIVADVKTDRKSHRAAGIGGDPASAATFTADNQTAFGKEPNFIAGRSRRQARINSAERTAAGSGECIRH